MSRANTKGKILKETTTTVVNNEGEVIEQTNTTEINIPREPNFVKVYIEGISRLFELSGGENKFLIELLKYVTYENEITLNAGVKKKISEKTGFKLQTIDNNISTLKKMKIIRPTRYRGIYMINPEIFGKGDWKDIYKYRAQFQKLCVSFEITSDMKDIKDAKIKVKRVDDEEKIEFAAKSRNITSEELLAEIAKEDERFFQTNGPSPFDDFDEFIDEGAL